eukprot:1738897-Rhodomonas_salina.1
MAALYFWRGRPKCRTVSGNTSEGHEICRTQRKSAPVQLIRARCASYRIPRRRFIIIKMLIVVICTTVCSTNCIASSNDKTAK